MRPVNLIPPEQRRGERAPLRTGPLAYVVVGTLAAALLAVTGLVMTQNSITDRENEVAQLEVQRDAVMQRAQALAPYAEFAALQQTRETTITNLAQSRFDWERVMRELALVIPGDISLSSMEGTAGAGEEDPEATTGPALTMLGCAANQTAVAEFIAALEDIDGVSSVTLASSERADSGDGESEAGEGGCTSRPGLASFNLTAAFEGVAGAPLEPTSPTPSAAPVQGNSQEEQIGKARKAAGLLPGVSG